MNAPRSVARTQPTTVTRIRRGGGSTTTEQVDDVLVVEEPLSIQLDGRLIATTMRTPGHDFELAAGFCFTDGLLAGAPVIDVRYVPGPDHSVHVNNAVTVDTDGRAPQPRPRLGNVSSSCGWCGSDQIDDLCLRLGPLDPSPPIGLDVLATVPAAVRARQELFDVTGAVHAAAVFDREGCAQELAVGADEVLDPVACVCRLKVEQQNASAARHDDIRVVRHLGAFPG